MLLIHQYQSYSHSKQRNVFGKILLNKNNQPVIKKVLDTIM